MNHIQVSLYVLIVASTDTLNYHYRYLFTCEQAIRTNYLHDLSSDVFIIIVDQLLNEIKVNQYHSLLIPQLYVVRGVKLYQALNSFQKHGKVRICVRTADLRFVDVDFQWRFFIKEIVNEVLQYFFPHHVRSSNL